MLYQLSSLPNFLINKIISNLDEISQLSLLKAFSNVSSDNKEQHSCSQTESKYSSIHHIIYKHLKINLQKTCLVNLLSFIKRTNFDQKSRSKIIENFIIDLPQLRHFHGGVDIFRENFLKFVSQSFCSTIGDESSTILALNFIAFEKKVGDESPVYLVLPYYGGYDEAERYAKQFTACMNKDHRIDHNMTTILNQALLAKIIIDHFHPQTINFHILNSKNSPIIDQFLDRHFASRKVGEWLEVERDCVDRENMFFQVASMEGENLGGYLSEILVRKEGHFCIMTEGEIALAVCGLRPCP